MDNTQWKMVPVNPTPIMISEGSCASSLPGPHYISESAALKCWQNMLAVSPQPPSASGEREAFEARAAAIGLDLTRLSPPRSDDHYCDAGTDAAWKIWQARAALAPSPGIDAAGQKPIGYVDPVSILNLKASTSHREWMWREPSAGAVPVYTAPPAAQPSADDAQFPFYELRFIMRVLSHEGSAPKEDWQTAYGMARKVFEQWSKDSKAAAEWLAEAERLVEAYAKEFAQGGATYARDIRRAALLAHLKARP